MIVACSGNLDEQNLLADLQPPKHQTFARILETLDQQVLLLTDEDWQNARWVTDNYYGDTLARSFWCILNTLKNSGPFVEHQIINTSMAR